MRVRIHDGAAAFLEAADPFIRTDPLSANVIAVNATQIAGGRAHAALDARDAGRLWVTIEDADGGVVGLGMHTPPYPPFLSRMPAHAAAALAVELAGHRRGLTGVNGARESVRHFADAWRASTGQDSVVDTSMRLYRLEQLSQPAGVSGAASLATEEDLALVADWLVAFHEEARLHPPSLDSAAIADFRIAAREIHLWRDGDRGTPVALAGVSPPAAGVARIGPVYTPSASRRRGYGAAVTAAASAAALAAGAEQVALYTDLANPTSNSIYQAIGYRPDHDAEERSFG
jgi:GNAT superfamily N-acetyltransferase